MAHMDGQSFSTISRHLKECHGIIRSSNSIRTCFYRFEIFSLKAQSIFENLIQDFFQLQEIKFAIFDESFYNSLYNNKLCMGVILLPETRVIAAIKVTKNHNQDLIRQVMLEFKQKISDLDIIGVDLAPMYTNPISEVFTAISIQYCIFHFFQILYRNVFNPFAIKVRQLLKEKINIFRNKIKENFKRMRTQLPGRYISLLEELEKRFKYCLKKRYLNYLIIDFEIFLSELLNSIKEINEKNQFIISIDSNENIIIKELELIHSVSKNFLTKLKRNPHLRNFQELFTLMDEVKQLFRLTDEQSYDKKYQKIEKIVNKTSNPYSKEILNYLEKYQSNLTVYLYTGVEKTTSLLEQVNQRMKKSSKNNRGGHYESTLQSYANIYQFFWNTEPLQLKGEFKDSKKSPIDRLSNSIKISDLIDLNGEWWNWLQPISYHEYRKHVIMINKKRQDESQILLDKRKIFKINSSADYSTKAKIRWENSKTLKNLREIDNIENKEEPSILLSKICMKGLSVFDKDIYYFLLEFPRGANRAVLCSFFKLPRSTVYDSLARLEVRNLVIRKTILNEGRGRKPIHFLANPIPNG